MRVCQVCGLAETAQRIFDPLYKGTAEQAPRYRRERITPEP
jgi:hypothetical protein